MTRGGAKSNLTKWNLIGGIQFKHVKNTRICFFKYFFFYFKKIFFLISQKELHLFQTSRGQVTRFLPQIYKIMKFTPFWVTYPKLVKKVNVLRGGDLDLINY